jgi:acetoin utilization deacetylase AcuC-like enzyme
MDPQEASVRYVYDSRHLLHDPDLEVQYGIPLPIYEIPDRAEVIRRALASDDGFVATEPTDHGRDPIDAVHDPGLLRYLEHAWRDWRDWQAGQDVRRPVPAIVPDTVLHPSLRDGMGELPDPIAPIARIGRWCWDTMTPLVEGTYEAARAAVDVALSTADLVLAGERIAYGIARPPGHHAPRGSFGGYCFLNNAAIVAEHLARVSGERVAVLDVDYHHGNGTQQIFYDRADVFYASLHGDPARAYPYFVGFADERGTGPGLGTNLNIPLPAGCDAALYEEGLNRALDAIARFRPGTLVVSLGIDTYSLDPICDFALTTPAYHRIGARVARLDLPTIVIQEGGYFVPHLGENVRQWLRGAEGRDLDPPDREKTTGPGEDDGGLTGLPTPGPTTPP